MTTMRPIRETLPLDEAMALFRDAATPIARTERVPLREASGRVLAAATSRRRRRASVRPRRDGWLRGGRRRHLRRRTLRSEVLRCVEQGLHRRDADPRRRRGECIEIATGAPMPEGADAVVMVEETEKAGEDRGPRLHAGLSTPARRPARGGHRRRADAPRERGPAEPEPHRRARRVGVLDVEVYARPRVAVLSTGNEIVEPGTSLGPGQIYDINQFTLSAIIGEHGGVAVPLLPAPTAWPNWWARSAPPPKPTSSCSPAAARSANAT